MVLDERLEFADALTLSVAGTGLANIGDVVPLSQPRNAGSPPRGLYLVITITTTVTGASGGLSFQLVSDAVSPPAVDGSATVHWVSKVTPVAGLVAGAVVAVVPLPGEPPNYEPYLGLQQNAAGSAVSAGAINAFLVNDPTQWKAYPDALA